MIYLMFSHFNSKQIKKNSIDKRKKDEKHQKMFQEMEKVQFKNVVLFLFFFLRKFYYKNYDYNFRQHLQPSKKISTIRMGPLENLIFEMLSKVRIENSYLEIFPICMS